jgi:predicted kinase
MTHEKTLYLIRGLTGSGKTTLADMIGEGLWLEHELSAQTVSTDDYWTRPDGEYRFDASQLKKAHAYIQDTVRGYMKGLHEHVDAVIVHNTFSCNWEMKPYKDMAREYGWSVFVIECQNDFGSTHDVPDEVRERMAERWERNAA